MDDDEGELEVELDLSEDDDKGGEDAVHEKEEAMDEENTKTEECLSADVNTDHETGDDLPQIQGHDADTHEAGDLRPPQDVMQTCADDETEGRIDLGADAEDEDEVDHSDKHSDKDNDAASAHSSEHSANRSRDGSNQQQAEDDDENFDLYGDVGGSFTAMDDDKDDFNPKDLGLKSKDDESRRNVRLDNVGPTSESCKVTVSKLQWWTSDAVLEDFFESCGKVRKIIFSEEKTNGKSKGIAMIEFSDSEGAMKAVEKNGASLDDVQICVAVHRPAVQNVPPMEFYGQMNRMQGGRQMANNAMTRPRGQMQVGDGRNGSNGRRDGWNRQQSSSQGGGAGRPGGGGGGGGGGGNMMGGMMGSMGGPVMQMSGYGAPAGSGQRGGGQRGGMAQQQRMGPPQHAMGQHPMGQGQGQGMGMWMQQGGGMMAQPMWPNGAPHGGGAPGGGGGGGGGGGVGSRKGGAGSSSGGGGGAGGGRNRDRSRSRRSGERSRDVDRDKTAGGGGGAGGGGPRRDRDSGRDRDRGRDDRGRDRGTGRADAGRSGRDRDRDDRRDRR